MSGGTTMLAAKEQAFIDLHTQHSARVYRYIACRISDRHRAEELAADVFRIAWEKELSEPPGIGWLLATARNVIGNEYKGRRRRQELVERLKDEARSQVPASNDEERAAVAEVLVQLRERDREVLMLSYWDELTIAELAQTLGCSSSARCGPPAPGTPGVRESCPLTSHDRTEGLAMDRIEQLMKDAKPRVGAPGAAPGSGSARSIVFSTDPNVVPLAGRTPARRNAVRAAAATVLAAAAVVGAVVVGGQSDAATSARAGPDGHPDADCLRQPIAASPPPSTAAPTRFSRQSRYRSAALSTGRASRAPWPTLTSSATTSSGRSSRLPAAEQGYYTVLGCADGWLAYSISDDGVRALQLDGGNAWFKIAKLQNGRFLCDVRQEWASVFNWEFQAHEQPGPHAAAGHGQGIRAEGDTGRTAAAACRRRSGRRIAPAACGRTRPPVNGGLLCQHVDDRCGRGIALGGQPGTRFDPHWRASVLHRARAVRRHQRGAAHWCADRCHTPWR